MTDTGEKVAFIGLGNMGEPMARMLLGAGFELAVVPHTRREAAERLEREGARIAGSPREAARDAAFAITMVPDLAQVEEVTLGENGLARNGARDLVLLNTSTVLPSGMVSLSERLAEMGVRTVDAPVSGGPLKANDGTLTIMASGAREDYEKALPLLEVMGQNVYYVGGAGSAQVAKLCNNALGAMIMLANSEVLTMGAKAGLDVGMLREIILNSSGGNFILESWLPQNVLKNEYEAGFALQLMYKDVGLARSLAQQQGTPMLLGNLAHELYGMFNNEESASKDYSVVSRLYQDAANIHIADGLTGSEGE